MAEPEFLRPTSVAEAVGLLDHDDAVVLAGGTSVGILLGQGLIEPGRLVWLGAIEGLATITRGDGALRLGAGATLRQVAAHPDVMKVAPAVAFAAGAVGNPRVRAVATVGGALAHADPRQDLPPALAACGAEVEIHGPAGVRRVPVAELAMGFLETVLAPDELITAVEIPVASPSSSVYLRYTPGSVADFPTVAAAASTVWDGRGALRTVRLVLGGVAPAPLVVPETDRLVGGDGGGPEALAAVAAAARDRARPVSDRLGSADYKRAMAELWARRALAACLTGGPAPGAAVPTGR